MEESPAWMVCEDLISRIKGELMHEAVELLHKEIGAGRIKVDGGLVTALEGTSEAEQDSFILGKLVAEEPMLMERYANYLSAVGENSEPELVARIEELKKFLLAVSHISILVRHANSFSAWFEDAGKQVKISDPSEIFHLTAIGSKERKEALEYVANSKSFSKMTAFSEKDLGTVKKAEEKLGEVA